MYCGKSYHPNYLLIISLGEITAIIKENNDTSPQLKGEEICKTLGNLSG